MKLLSIIIISYNRYADLLELLQDITKLNNLDLLEEVIVLNNKSTDDYSGLNDFIQQNPTINFKLFDAPENLGVSRGRNYATRLASGNIFVYFDDDVNIEDPDILPKIANSFKTKLKGVPGAVSFKVFYKSNRLLQVNAFPHKKFNKYKDYSEFLTYYFSGCAHAITKEAWNKTGEYPAGFFYGMEEYDFCYRLLNLGYTIKYDASVVIYHKESPFGRKPKNIKLRMMWVNKTIIAWKLLPKVYFYSTAIMWSVEYLKKTSFNIPGFFKGWWDIFGIPGKYKRTPVSKNTLAYLKETEARLWY